MAANGQPKHGRVLVSGQDLVPMRIEVFDGVPLEVPNQSGFSWPAPDFASFPGCCGPGSGIGERLVKDRPLGVVLSPACWVHDEMFGLPVKSRPRFVQANEVFLRNMLVVVAMQGRRLPARKCKALVTLAARYHDAVASPVGWVWYLRSGG